MLKFDLPAHQKVAILDYKLPVCNTIALQKRQAKLPSLIR
jgi:hypothetical protein